MRNQSQRGFTLAELIFVIGIMSVVIVGMMKLYIYASMLAELAGNKTYAVSEAHNKLEEIRNHTYDQIATDYASGGTPGNTFNVSNLTGKGFIYVDSSNANLLQVKVAVCWRDKYSRIVGECSESGGSLVAGTDADGDGAVSSPATLITNIAKKS